MKVLFILMLSFSMMVSAETSEDVVRDIINMNGQFDAIYDTMQINFSLESSTAMRRSLPLIGSDNRESFPEDLVAKKEQLMRDFRSSDVFRLDKKEFELAIIKQWTKEMTYEELVSVRKFYSQPIFKKILSVTKQVEAGTKEYLHAWSKENLEKLKPYLERAKEISKLASEHLLNTMETKEP